ncbi:MAG TPA: hypothetical protein VF803_02055 [Candidatus Paceibacterota bacterium]
MCAWGLWKMLLACAALLFMFWIGLAFGELRGAWGWDHPFEMMGQYGAYGAYGSGYGYGCGMMRGTPLWQEGGVSGIQTTQTAPTTTTATRTTKR